VSTLILGSLTNNTGTFILLKTASVVALPEDKGAHLLSTLFTLIFRVYVHLSSVVARWPYSSYLTRFTDL
jgi:hypothetical protein